MVYGCKGPKGKPKHPVAVLKANRVKCHYKRGFILTPPLKCINVPT